MSLLGSDYIMCPHRHEHVSSPGRPNQSWHRVSELAELF
jgi:hypothetical protein